MSTFLRRKNRLGYSLQELLVGAMLLVLGVGFALKVDVACYSLSHDVVGYWDFRLFDMLRGWGFPDDLLAYYVVFGVKHIPGWLVLAAISAGLGLHRERFADVAAWSIVVGIPVSSLLLDAAWGYIAHMNFRLISGCGAGLVLAAWGGGRVLAERFEIVDRLKLIVRRPVVLVLAAGVYAVIGGLGWVALQREMGS